MRALPRGDDAVDLVVLGHLPIIASDGAFPVIREDGCMPIPVILDVDTGVDDALALLFAAAHPELDLIGVSCVAGNAPLPQVVENTLRVLALAGATDVPVAAGAHRPLIESPRDASHVHGADGLAGVELPPAARTAEPEGAVAFLRRRILASPEPVTLVALAPQTNLALLLRTHPEVAANIARIVFMGGSASVGNATALAEFNVWHDPEAASIVLGSGVPLFMYGLDVFNHVSVARATTEALAASAELLPSVVGRLLDHRIASPDGTRGDYIGWIGDAGAVCALVDPDAFQIERLPVRVELAGYGRGQTVVDRREHPGEDAAHGLTTEWASVDVALGVDAERVARLFLDTVLPGR
jgi:pyrimidine-specific ribonucleoside hydrolase